MLEPHFGMLLTRVLCGAWLTKYRGSSERFVRPTYIDTGRLVLSVNLI